MTAKQAWIISADRKSLEHCARIGTFGLNRPGRLRRVKVGDLLIAYIAKEKTFGGIGRITKAYYLDDEEVFPWGLYPDRIGIELQLLSPKQAIDVWEVIDDLSFIPKEAQLYWAVYFRGGLRQIPIADYERIASKLKVHAR